MQTVPGEGDRTPPDSPTGKGTSVEKSPSDNEGSGSIPCPSDRHGKLWFSCNNQQRNTKNTIIIYVRLHLNIIT